MVTGVVDSPEPLAARACSDVIYGFVSGVMDEVTATTDDGVEHPFHCTAIAEGGRTIEVGAVVTFRVSAGRLGRWEATNLSPAGASA